MTHVIREFNSDNHEILKVFGYGIRDSAAMLDRVVAAHATRGEKQYPIKGYDAYISGWVFFGRDDKYAGYTSLDGV